MIGSNVRYRTCEGCLVGSDLFGDAYQIIYKYQKMASEVIKREGVL